jgi:hypothetical protein
MIATDSRLDIKLMVTRLKELECYDVLALVIKSIWLSPDPDVLPPHLWGWMEQETVGLFRVPGNPSWGPVRGYFPIISNTYTEPSPGDTLTTPGGAARYIFQHDGQPATQDSDGELVNTHHDIEAQQPPY